MEKKGTFAYLQQLSLAQIGQRHTVEQKASFLCVIINGKKINIPMHHVNKIVSNLRITKMGHTQPSFQGISRVDGEIYGVVNIDHLINPEKKSSPPIKNTVVTLAETDGFYGVIVKEVIGVIDLDLKKEQSKTAYTIEYAGENDEMYSVLSMPKLLNSPVFTKFSIF